jgi:hypothetical protein
MPLINDLSNWISVRIEALMAEQGACKNTNKTTYQKILKD